MIERFSDSLPGQESFAEKASTIEDNSHKEVLSSISNAILSASLQATRSQGRERQAASQLVADLLRARDEYIVGMAKARNPDIKIIDEKNGLYRAGNAEVYGSLWAVMDATPQLENDAVLANLLSSVPAHTLESVESIAGESLQPRSMIESQVRLAGSGAQDRVQQYATDLDFNEDIFIQASNEEEAMSLLVDKLQGAVLGRESAQGVQPGYQVLPQRIWIHPRGAAGRDEREWLPHEVTKGRKRFYDEHGQLRELSFAESLQRAGKIQIEYDVVTGDQAFRATQMCYVAVANERGIRHLGTDPSPGRAYQDVYFNRNARAEQPDTSSPELLVGYLGQMADQLRMIEGDSPPDNVKALKRFYNFSKAAGDFETLEQLEDLFSNPAIHVYQIAKRLPTAYEVWEQTGNRRPLDALFSQLAVELPDEAHLAQMLQQRVSSTSIHVIARTIIEHFVEPAIAEFMSAHPEVGQKLARAKQFSRVR